MKIHITLIGREVLPTFYTIMEYQPDITYLIGTNDTNESIKRISNVLRQKGIKYEVCLSLPFDAKETKNVCERIHEQNGEECEYIYNITGGTKPMAFGAMMCAQSHNAKLVYTDSLNCIDLTSSSQTPLSCNVDLNTIFSLQGQKLLSKDIYTPNPLRTQCAEEIRDFIKNHRVDYDVIRKEYSKLKKISRVFDAGLTHYKRGEDYISVYHGNIEVFYSDYRDAYHMLFEGRWWETLVADAVNEWADGKKEIWTSVMFEPNNNSTAQHKNGKQYIKNEIDILVNLGNTMLFVECKSGDFMQDNIYKLSSICKVYGSYKSKGVIVSFYPCRQDLLEKGNDENIEIIDPKMNCKLALDKHFNERLTKIVNTLKV